MIPVCVFAKAPVPGAVKTRLIPDFGCEGAAELAAAMFVDTWHAVSSTPGVRPLLATVNSGVFPVAIDSRDVWLQGDGDLGIKLERILRRALSDAAAAIAVGADTPLLASSHIEAGVRALDGYDAVMGRCPDGGFYLLGLRKCPEGLLSSIPWSTCETAGATAQRLRQRKMELHELVHLFDVDVPGDLRWLIDNLQKNATAAPATRDWCVRNRLLGNNR
jgi:rSAM/selenodomain-associated transferase 1